MNIMLRLEKRKMEKGRVISVPPKHAGCKRRGSCVLNKLVEAKRRTETKIEDAQRGIIKAGDDKSRTEGFVALKTEGRRRETIMNAMAKISECGSCEGVESVLDDFDKKMSREDKVRQILIKHLQIEKGDAEAMIDDCIEAKKRETNLDAILENDGFQREEERRLGRINNALEKLERGACGIQLQGLMAAHRIEHIENMIEQAYA